MTVYCIEIKTGDTWAPKDICHCKIPTEEKANARMSEMISSEGSCPSDDIISDIRAFAFSSVGILQ